MQGSLAGGEMEKRYYVSSFWSFENSGRPLLLLRFESV